MASVVLVSKLENSQFALAPHLADVSVVKEERMLFREVWVME
jgi:hypothetical protein